MPRLHGYRWAPGTEPQLALVESSIAPRALLPAARLGRSAIGAGGVLARLWDWLCLPAVERFRCCASCGERFAFDLNQRMRVGTRLCGGRDADGRCVKLVADIL